ncbi:hypothetical protein [Nocardioides stalactiti]|uniref:hypothetical protein n=1 Tax=Nocardioides stalactiti TaxID=2755356 RepID=UPI0016043A0F|nr:hypothetical protein [Nocardioides stalactiti]
MTIGRPTFTDLLDWVEGRLAPEQADVVAAYVATADDATMETVEWIREFHDAAGSMRLEQPPADLSARLRDVFVGLQGPEVSDRWSDASLLYDTRSGLAAAGVRSYDGDGVHLAFDSDLGRFLLEASPAGPGEVDIQGLIRTELIGDDGVDLSFLGRGTLRRAARATADGRFDVRGVPVDVDELWLSSGGTRVRAALDLTSR